MIEDSQPRDSSKIDLSIVIPLYNEEESIPYLYEEIKAVIDSQNYNVEVIIVDDGSSDNSFEKLRKIHDKDNRFKVISFRRNFGQTAALQAGFDKAKGEVIVTLDADLENDPKNIPDLLAKLDEGYDIVSGLRAERWSGGLMSLIKRKLPSAAANYLISRTSQVRLHDTGCTLKAYRREVLSQIRLYGDSHRFIPAMASQYGARVSEVEVNFRPRRFGTSKYGFSRTIKVFLDVILLRFMLEFSTRPMQFFGFWGLLAGGLGFVFGLYLTLLKILGHQNIGSRPLLLLSVLLLFLGVQLVMMGLLGELLSRTYFESQGKKTYSIKEALL